MDGWRKGLWFMGVIAGSVSHGLLRWRQKASAASWRDVYRGLSWFVTVWLAAASASGGVKNRQPASKHGAFVAAYVYDPRRSAAKNVAWNGWHAYSLAGCNAGLVYVWMPVPQLLWADFPAPACSAGSAAPDRLVHYTGADDLTPWLSAAVCQQAAAGIYCQHGVYERIAGCTWDVTWNDNNATMICGVWQAFFHRRQR